ncbi:MAG: galactokinase [Planctomycetia bacterium]|nr:galactokinase [Planctomycetia bacterium]
MVPPSYPDRIGATDVTVVSPGRVNLIGEHTDYNDGFVLPLAIERGLEIAVRRRTGSTVRLLSDRGGPAIDIDVGRPLVAGTPCWTRYAAGVIAGFQRLGWTIPGFEALITADLPVGGGLSSSAALEVGIATVIEALCGRALDPVDKALLCQRAEHEFAGVPCGLMDQLAVTCGRRGHALLVDCRSRDVRPVPLGDEIRILVIDSGVKHALGDGGYATRRRECETAARLLGVKALRDVTPLQLAEAERRLPEPERRRARHVVTENERVLSFVAAAERADWPTAGRLMNASHASLRDAFEVSCRELDLICDAVGDVDGVYGRRMTGGGFGGCAVALVDATRADAVEAAATTACTAALGHPPTMFLTHAAAGAATDLVSRDIIPPGR